MPFCNSFPASSITSPENIPPLSPNNFNYSMSQGAYISARMTNRSRSALPPRAVVPSGYSQVVIAERMAGIRYAALSNLSNLATETGEEGYSPFAMPNNYMITLPPPAPWVNDLIQIQQTFRALMPSDYSQLQSDSTAGISRAALYNFSDHFAPCIHEMVSSPFVSDSNNNIPLQFPWAYSNIPPQFPWASTANIPIAARQTSRADTLIASQQAFRANNNTPLQLCGASWSYDLSVQQSSRALILSDCSQFSNAERLGQTNPAMVNNFSSYFACESNEIVTTCFASSNIIPSQEPCPWVDLIRAPPPAPRLSDFLDFLTRTTSNNFDSLLLSSSNPLPSSILPVLDHSGLIQSTDDLLSDMYCCSMCSAMFPSPQALGGHMSRHSKEKRKRDQLNVMPSTSRGHANNMGGSAAYEDYWFDIGESSSKKKVKRESS